MLFNSYSFLFLFSPISIFIFRFFETREQKNILINFLLLISVFFYGYWDVGNFLVIIPSILFNYFLGKKIESININKIRKYLLIFGIFINIFIIVLFKYSEFLFSIFGLKGGYPIAKLPLGISFFTFTQISYIVDSYYKKQEKANLSEYALFVTYFPHLISGPLLHHKDMISQFRKNFKNIDFDQRFMVGFIFLAFGLFKKVIIADRLAPIGDKLFNAIDLSVFTLVDIWKCIIAYAMQLYFDFSGYSDMAIGISKFFAIDLPFNFNSPYKSKSIADFWRRWHMSLSSFLRDYVYIPLGGSHKGFFKKLINLFIVMILCGVWHGAGYCFIIWGALHGLYLIINNIWQKLNFFKLPKLISWAITFIAIIIGWIFFRAANVITASKIIYYMFANSNIGSFSFDVLIVFMVSLFAILGPNTQEIILQKEGKFYEVRPSMLWALITASLLALSIFKIQQFSPFLYFQF